MGGTYGMLDPDKIKAAIEQALPGSLVHVEDMTGSGDHFQAIVVSSEFEGKGLVDQHRLVYDALREVMAGDIHALALKTYTPEQWRRGS